MGLTGLQWKFIGARLLNSTDKAAALEVGINPDTVPQWKQEPEFAHEYQAAFSDGVHVAQEYTRKLLGKAAQRLDEALDATKTVAVELKAEYFGTKKKRQYEAITEPDHKARLEAAKILFQAHGLLKEKVDIEIRIRQIAEQMGLDPEAAVEEAKRIVGVAGTRRS